MHLSTTTKTGIWLAILFITLLLPPGTHEASRDLCKGSTDGVACAETLPALSTGRKVSARKTKFKFHKIELLDEDDDEEDNNNENKDEDDDDDGDGNEDGDNDEDGDDNDVGNEEDDNDDDNDNDNDDNEDGTDANDEDTAAEEEDDESNKPKARRAKRKKDLASIETNDDQDEEDDKPSLLSRIMGIFSSDADEAETETAKKQEHQFELTKTFNWLYSLIERTEEPTKAGKSKEKSKTNDDETDWLTYLKRWPFNSIFPETPKSPTRSRERSTGSKISQAAGSTKGRQQAKSEEYMELLIHSLPAFIGNVSQAQSGDCYKQLELLHRQMRAHKLWTLQMLDATGKIGAGLLRGNINQFGDFEQCTQVSTAIKASTGKTTRVHGKYCLAHIELRATVASLKEPLHFLHGRGLWHAQLKHPKHFVPRYSIANWGICLPHACSAHVVHSIIETSLRPYNDTGLEFHVDVRDEQCTTKQRKSFMKLLGKDNSLAMGVFILASLGFACLVSTAWEHWHWISSKLSLNTAKDDSSTAEQKETDEEEKTEELEEESPEAESDEKPSTPALHLRILNAFSPQRTLQSLLSLEGPDVEFPLIHLLKILATFMLYINLKYIMAGHLPITNRDAFVGTVNRFWSTAYRVPLLYSDMLLLLSGFLVAHQLSQEMETTCRLSFLKNVAKKASRYVPNILAVFGFQAWILPHLGTGPLWNQLVGENARLCEESMWRNALSVQNTGEVEDMCSPLTVQLSLDVQLYFLGALVVWLYFTDPEAGFYLCGAFHAVSVAMRYSRTSREHLAASLFHGLNVSKFYRTANLIYISPVARATAYLLGLGAGLLYRNEEGSFSIPTRFRRTGWALATLCIGWCFWSPVSSMHSKFVYKTADAASYLAWSPLILGLGICWCLLMTPLNKSVLERYPNLARAVLFLSRIEVPLQLASFVIVLWNTASVKEPQQFQTTDLLSLSELACIVCFAILVAFLVDFPSLQIVHLLIDYILTETLLTTVKDNVTADATNAIESEESTEVKSDSPEPVESIWPSDTEPEEEEKS